MGVICDYRFDKTIDSNLYPTFNSNFINYTVVDVEEPNNIIKRTISHDNDFPTIMDFNGKRGLIEFLDGDIRNLTTMSWMFGNCTNATVINVSNFDTSKVTNMNYAFYNCYQVLKLDVSNFKTGLVTSFQGLFYNCSLVTELDVSNFDTRSAINFASMFAFCRVVKNLDVSRFNTEKATNMHGMFEHCNSVTELTLSSFNTSSVIYMGYMFSDCHALTDLNTSSFDTRKVIEMQRMFNTCRSLISLNVSHFVTTNVIRMDGMFANNHLLERLDLRNFRTALVTNFGEMFSGCYVMETLDISSFDTSSAISMNGMFRYCQLLNPLNVSHFNTSSVTRMDYMFDQCQSVLELNVRNFNTSQVTRMDYMFCQCNLITTLDLSSFDTRNVIQFNNMFENCYSLTELNLSNFYTPKTTTFYAMFYNCLEVRSLNISNFDTRNATNIGCMFYNCYKLESLNVSHFDTNNVTNMNSTFRDCRVLTSLNLLNFRTHNVTSMHRMFFNCPVLTELNISNFNTSNVTDMAYMFESCKALTSLDLSHFDTSRVTNMTSMFYNCIALESLDVSSFNTSNVTQMPSMFDNLQRLKQLDVSGFDTRNVTSASSMFNACHVVESLDVSNFVLSKATTINNMFSACRVITELDVSNFQPISAINVYSIFEGCWELKTVNLKNFKTPNAKGMQTMFNGCRSIETLDLSDFDTSSATNMNSMFNSCTSLLELDLSSFDTRNVTTMNWMFYNCKKLKKLSVSSFNTSNVKDMSYAFNSLLALESLDLSSFDTRNVTAMHYLVNASHGIKYLDVSNFHITPSVAQAGLFYGNNIQYIGMLYCDLTSVNLLTQTLTNSLEKEVYLADVDPELATYRQRITFKTYKSNELKPTEDVSLGKLGTLEDEINFANGELTERVGKIVLNQLSHWGIQYRREETTSFISEQIPDAINKQYDQSNLACDKLLVGGYGIWSKPYSITLNTKRFSVTVPKEIADNVTDFVNWLSKNDINVHYALETEKKRFIDFTISSGEETLTYKSNDYGQIESSTINPVFKYRLNSSNSFSIPNLKPKTTYTVYYEGSPTLVTCGGETNILLRNPQTVNSGNGEHLLFFDSFVENVQLIEGDTTTHQIPYFLGTLDTVQPTIQIDGQSFKIPFTLRSSETTFDQFDLLTGQFIQMLDENHQPLASPVSQRLSVPNFPITSTSEISLAVEGVSLLPYLSYSCHSPNHYFIDISANQVYTIKCKKTKNGTFSLGGVSSTLTENQIVSTRSSDHRILFEGDLGVSELVIVKGDVRSVLTPYFLGMKSVVNPTLRITNGTNEQNSLKISLTLKKISETVKDEFDVITQTFIKRIGERAFQAGDEANEAVLTDGVTTLYALPSEVTSKHQFEWTKGTFMSYDEKTRIYTICNDLYPHIYIKLPISTLEETLRLLKLKNIALEEENVSTMMAITEVFEMMMYIMPSEMATINITALTNADTKAPKGGFQMVEVYVTLILKGKKTLDQVPAMIRPKVEAQLVELGALEA